MKRSDKDNLNILYEDNHIIVVVKEKGILTQPSPQKEYSLEFLVKEYLKKKENKKSIFLHVLHRLDKDVSGIVLFAKSTKALQRLNLQMREKEFEKVYTAEVEGIFELEQGIYTDYLVHTSHKAKVVSSSNKQAKESVLEYKVLEQKKNTALLEINLVTGRYHQIRCQLSYHGHPILGDTKYGGKAIGVKGIKLHQSKLSFIHPTLKNEMVFTSSPV